ncbi:MAG: thiamine-phosphate pyrophosphorylase [Candidatus Omnitrophota bacterium]
MQKLTEKKQHRIIDANFNRAKEGLRVCEDICRFIYGKKRPTQIYKNIRHQLTAVLARLNFREMIRSRDIAADVGKGTIRAELSRKNIDEVFYANSQRVKESIRVLEEFLKLRDVRLSQKLKKIRYTVYAIEKEIIAKL